MNTETKLYQELIDTLAEKSKSCVNANWARSGEAKGTGEQIAKLNALFAKLNANERETIAQFAQDAYASGMYDTLCELEWYIDCKKLRLLADGAELPVTKFEGLGNDFIGRRECWEWPKQ